MNQSADLIAGLDSEYREPLCLLLYIRSRPISIDYRPLLDDSNGFQLLPTLLTRLGAVAAGLPLRALVSGPERSLYKSHLLKAGFELIDAIADTEIRSVVCAGQLCKTNRVVITYPEVALKHASLVADLRAIASDDDSDFIVFDGSPPQALPLCFRPDALAISIPFIEDVSRVAGIGGNWPLRAAIDAVERAVQLSGGTAWRATFRHVKTSNSHVFEPRIPVESPGDVDRARTALHEDDPCQTVVFSQPARKTERPGVPPQPPIDDARRRVLFVCNACAFTGGHEALCQLIANLNREQYQPLALVSVEGFFAARLRQAACQVICPNKSFATSDLETFEYLLQTLRLISPHVIHISDFSGMSLFYAAAALAIPTVFHVRVPGARLLREPLLAAHQVIAVSELIREEIIQNGIPAGKVTTAYSGVDIKYYSPSPEARIEGRRLLGATSDERMIVMVGRFQPIKRHDVLIRAVAELKGRWPRLRCALLGEGDTAFSTLARVKRLIDDLGLSDTVRVHRFERNMRAVYAAADVFVLCSDNEPLGMSALQAMASGTPTILATVGELHNLLKGTNAARTCGVGDHMELAASIAAILGDASLAGALSKAGRQFVLRTFDGENTVGTITKLYERMS